MTNIELNKFMLKSFPGLENAYLAETSWQEGDVTGSHVVYGDVFCPYIEKMYIEKNDEELNKIFQFIESILSIESLYCDEVIAFSVLEKLYDHLEQIEYMRKFMGDKSLKICAELSKYISQETITSGIGRLL